MSFVLLSFLLIIPIISLPVFIFVYFIDKKGNGLFYSILIGVCLGLFAYYFQPKSGYDLVRHHLIVNSLQGKSFFEFYSLKNSFELEFLPLLYSYIISFFNNVNLLQFFVVAGGYSIILYILHDYRKISNINNYVFIPLFLFTFFGFQHLYFISGLYCYLAIILFSFSLYNEYVKNKSKNKCMIIYVTTLFIHNSMFLPFGVLILYKLLKEKSSFSLFFISIILFYFSFIIVEKINIIFNNNLTNSLVSMYGDYMNRNNHFKTFYSGTLFFIEMSKLFIILISTFFNKNKMFKKLDTYIILFSMIVLLMMTRTRVAIRYIMVIQIVGIVPLVQCLKSSNKTKCFIITILMLCLGIFYFIYYYKIFVLQDFGNLKVDFYKNIISILKN